MYPSRTIKVSNGYKRAEIVVVSDAHIGHNACDEKYLERVFHHVKMANNKYVIILGDLVETAMQHSRIPIWDQKIPPKEQMEYCLEALKPIRNRILAYITGNHERRIYNATSLDLVEMISKKLKVPFYGDILGFQLKVQTDHGVTTARIACAHGNSGAQVNLAIREFDNLIQIYPKFDLYLLGHTHKLYQYRRQHGEGNPFDCVRCGTSMGWAKYAQGRIYRPTPVGFPLITIGEGKIKVDIGDWVPTYKEKK